MSVRFRARGVLFAGLAALTAVTGCGVTTQWHVAFMGDSITAYWTVPGTDLGVPGNTTAQMLTRFPNEVIGHGFRTVVILAGVNDLRKNRNPEEAMANIDAMVEAAKQANITPVLCELTPDFEQDDLVLPRVRALNQLIVKYAADNHVALADFFEPLLDHPEDFKDGLHPNEGGYAVMDKTLFPILGSLTAK